MDDHFWQFYSVVNTLYLGWQISDIGLATVLNHDKIALVSAFVLSVDLYVVNWFLFLYVCFSCLKGAGREH